MKVLSVFNDVFNHGNAESQSSESTSMNTTLMRSIDSR